MELYRIGDLRSDRLQNETFEQNVKDIDCDLVIDTGVSGAYPPVEVNWKSSLSIYDTSTTTGAEILP